MSDGIRFRAPAVSERTAVFMMGYDAWGDGLPTEAYLHQCVTSPKYRRGQWLALEADGQLVSALITYSGVFSLPARAVGIGSLATAPHARGKGFATALLRAVIARADGIGAAAIFLHSEIGSSLYERLGFVALPSGFQRRAGSLCMVRTATPSWLGEDFVPPEYF